jgi:hypothetical protein
VTDCACAHFSQTVLFGNVFSSNGEVGFQSRF